MICVKSCLFGNTYSLSILSWGLKLCRMRDLRDSAPVHFTVGMQYMYDIRWAPRSMYKYNILDLCLGTAPAICSGLETSQLEMGAEAPAGADWERIAHLLDRLQHLARVGVT